MPRRKIVIFIVEGLSDLLTLASPISDLINQKSENYITSFLRIDKEYPGNKKITNGDITSGYYYNKKGTKVWITVNSLAKAIYDMILHQCINFRSIWPEDISEIIQIVDTDGTFIPSDNVEYSDHLPDVEKPYYCKDKIECADPHYIIKRNMRKSENLNHIVDHKFYQITVNEDNMFSSAEFTDIGNNSRSVVGNKRTVSIPYSVYYFSSNLDHYIHSDANYPHEDKVGGARKFSGTLTDPVSFREFFKDQDVQEMDYIESWNYIKDGVNSLQRHTNLNVLIRDHLSQPDL